MKGHLDDTTASTRPNLFNTRDRAERARKHNMVSHTFSLKNLLQYESYIVFIPMHHSDSGTNSLGAERKHFWVQKLRDGSEGKDASGMIPSLVS